MGETLTLKLRNPTDEQREMINSNECIYAQWNEPAAQPDPNRPCDTHGISGCERCFGWCDHGAPDPKDALTTARLEEALALTRALVAERDQLRARVQELEAEHAVWEKHGLCEMVKDRDAARAECQRLKADIVDVYERCERLEAQAARMREALECIETGRRDGNPTPDALLAAAALAETDAGGLVQGLVKALETIRGLAMMSARPPDSYTARIMDACTEALDAWNRCGRGRDGQ